MKKTIGVAIVGGIVLAGCLVLLFEDRETSPCSHCDGLSRVPGPSISSAGLSSRTRPLLNGNIFTAAVHPNVAVEVIYQPAQPDPVGVEPVTRTSNGIEWTGTELEPDVSLTSGYKARVFERGPFPVSYHIDGIGSRSSHHIFTVGRQMGKMIVEEWVFQPEDGGYYTHRSFAGTPIGQPAPTSVVTGDLHGSTYIPPKFRTPVPPFREIILQRSISGSPIACAADPEGRFLLICLKGPESTARIVQLDLSDKSLTDVYDQSSISMLPNATGISPLENSIHGRIYRLSSATSPYEPVGVIVDQDNDGVFTSYAEFSDLSHFSDSNYGSANWVDNFLDYKF